MPDGERAVFDEMVETRRTRFADDPRIIVDGAASQKDAALQDSCVPTCKANACDVTDACGGVCHCDAGVPCVAGTCGGCLGLANSYCSTGGPVDGSTPGTCCGVGDECKFYGDASRCCGITYATDVTFVLQSDDDTCPVWHYTAPTQRTFTVNNPSTTCVDAGLDAGAEGGLDAGSDE
jgi:hypothetical protein